MVSVEILFIETHSRLIFGLVYRIIKMSLTSTKQVANGTGKLTKKPQNGIYFGGLKIQFHSSNLTFSDILTVT